MISLTQQALKDQPLDWKKRFKQPLGHSLLNGLVEYWPLDDARSSNVNVTQRGIHAGLSMSMGSNNPQDAQGVYGGQASQFTKASGVFLKRTSESALQMGDIDFAMYGWIYLDTTPVGGSIILAKDDAASAREYAFYILSTGAPNFIAFNGTSTIIGRPISTTILSNLTWNFIVAYHSATLSECGISVNGAAYETVATTGAPGVNTTEFRIGDDARASTALGHNGRLERVSLYKNRILSQDDVTYLYNGGIGRKYPFI